MSASGIRAGQAYVKIATEQSLFDRGVAQVQASMRRLASVANTIGGTVGSGFGTAAGAMRSFAGGLMNVQNLLMGTMAAVGTGTLVKGFADSASKVDDMAQRTGMAAEEIGALTYAAQMSGTSIETVEKAIRKMQATTGGKSGMSATQEFMALADHIADIPDPTQRAAEAMKVFGKSGAELVPLLSNGADGIKEMATEANRLGLTMSAADAAAGAALGDSIDRLWASMSGLANQIGAALAPLMTWLADQMTGMVSYVANWIAETRRLAQTFTQLQKWGSIAMMGLEVAFRQGYQGIYNLWTDLTTWMVTSTVDAVSGVANIFAGIPTALMNGFSTAITWLTGAWDSTVNYIAKKLLYLYSLFDASIDYEAAAKGMDQDAAQRAKSRQASLDATTSQRNQELAAANASRSAMAENINQGIRADGSQRKSEYENRIKDLEQQIAATFESIASEADRIDAENAAAEQAKAAAAAAIAPGAGAMSGALASKSAGAFSGFAAGFLGGGVSAIDRLVDNGKKTNELLKAIADNTGEDDALEFDA